MPNNPSLNERLRAIDDDSDPTYVAAAFQSILPEILQALDDNERVAGILRAEIQRLANDVYGLFCGNCGIIKVAPEHVDGCPKANALEVAATIRADNALYRATIVQLEKERAEAVERVHALEASDRADEKEPF